MNKKIELFEFRVWFPDTKTFEYYPLYEQNGYTLMMKVMDRDITIYNSTYRDKFGDVSITRYTGLKDKSSKKIYEGDIVRTPLVSLFKKRIYVVEYFKNRFIPDDIEDTNDVEIIGNIFENPELCNSVTHKQPEEEKEEDEITLNKCENCGEQAWDGYICHSCGAKNI